MPDSILTVIRKALQSQAQTVPPFSSHMSQVVRGNYNFASAVPNYFGNMVNSGPWLYIEKCTLDADMVELNGEFAIPIKMAYGFALNTGYTWDEEDDVTANLVQVWANYSEWVQGKNLGGVKLTVGTPENRTDNPGGAGVGVALTPMLLTGRYTIDAQFLTAGGQ